MVVNNSCSTLLMGQVSSNFTFSQVSFYLCSMLFRIMITFSVCSYQSVMVLHVFSLMVSNTNVIKNTAFFPKSRSHIYRLYCFFSFILKAGSIICLYKLKTLNKPYCHFSTYYKIIISDQMPTREGWYCLNVHI